MRIAWTMMVSALASAGACALNVPPLIARDAAVSADEPPTRDANIPDVPNVPDVPEGGSPSCLEGQTHCSARCVDTQTESLHCGTCGHDCTRAPGSDGTCVGGQCQCVSNRANCDGDLRNGCEAHIDDDPAHCGACGARCTAPHSALACEAGRCVIRDCDGAWGDCDGDPHNGCEASLATTAHCGRCGAACAPTEHAMAVCVTGATTHCGFICDVGFGDCDGDPRNGCEVELTRNDRHCGGCNRPCNGVCVDGVCR